VPADADDRLAEQLRALRREYLTDSTQRVADLRRLLARVSSGEGGSLAELRQAFHRLAGSGGSYGFPVVSTQSREGEHLSQRLESAHEPVTPGDLVALGAAVDGVARAFADALRTLDPETPG
jgi:hypothetical protein